MDIRNHVTALSACFGSTLKEDALQDRFDDSWRLYQKLREEIPTREQKTL